MDPITHPNKPSELTNRWLTRVLAASDLLDGAPITGFDVEVIGEDRGFTGVVARITLHADIERSPATVVAKFPLAERAVESSYRRAQGAAHQIPRPMAERAAREIAFYRAIDSELDQIPSCYFGHADIDARRAVLLLEDLSGATPGDALTGCSVDEARSVLAGIQSIHARWWQNEDLDSMSWLGNWSASNHRRATGYQERFEPVITANSDRLSIEQVGLMRLVAPRLGQMLDDLATAPETLIHADMHLDNVMFRHAVPSQQAVIIDWQSPSRGPAMVDVAAFLVDSLSIEDRRSYEVELLQGYVAGLDDAGIRGYDLDRLFDDYLRAICVGLAGQVGWLHRVIGQKPAGREGALVDAVLDPGRAFTALIDHADRLADMNRH